MGDIIGAKRRRLNKNFVIALAVVAVVVVGVAVLWVVQHFRSIDKTVNAQIDFQGKTREELEMLLNTDVYYPGVSINKTSIASMTREQVKNMFESKTDDKYPRFTFTLDVDGKKVPVDTSAVVVTSNLDTAIADLHKIGRVVDESNIPADVSKEEREDIILSLRYKDYLDLAANPVNVDLEYDYKKEYLEAAVKGVLAPIEKDMKNATVTGFDTSSNAFSYADSVPGIDVDVDDALKQLNDYLDKGVFNGEISVKTEKIEPEISVEELKRTMDFITSATSRCADLPNRDKNISLVCQKINGLVIQPGGYFDFNEVVGERKPAGGFLPAPAIAGTVDTVDEIGGGICQVSSMLYQAALKSDLQIDARSNHTLNSDYAPDGIDAAVSWGSPNFRFTNNTDYPIAIKAYFNKPNITVEFYGRQLKDNMKIELSGEKTSNTPYKTVYEADPTLAVGRTISDGQGKDGGTAVAWKIYSKNGVEVDRVKANTSTYTAKDIIVKVGVLMPDGQIATINKDTGAVIPPTPVGTTSPPPAPPDAVQQPPPVVDAVPPPTAPPPPPAQTTAPAPAIGDILDGLVGN